MVWRGEPPPPSRGQKGPFLGVFAKTPKMPIFAIFAHFCADRKFPEISAPPARAPRAPARGGPPGGSPGGPRRGVFGGPMGVQNRVVFDPKNDPKNDRFGGFFSLFLSLKGGILGGPKRGVFGGYFRPSKMGGFVPANFVPKTQKIPKKKCPMFVPNGRFIKYPTKCAKFCPAGGPGVSRGGPGG